MRTGLAIGYVQLAILAHQRHQLGNGVFFLVQHFAVQHHTGNIIIVGQRNLDVVLILHELTNIIAGSNRDIHISRGVDQIVTLGNLCGQRSVRIFTPARIKSNCLGNRLVLVFSSALCVRVPTCKDPFVGTVAQLLRQVSNRGTMFNRRHSSRLFTMPIVVKGHSVLVLCPLGVIGFTLYGGRYCFTGKISVFIPTVKGVAGLFGSSQLTFFKCGIFCKNSTIRDSEYRTILRDLIGNRIFLFFTIYINSIGVLQALKYIRTIISATNARNIQ